MRTGRQALLAPAGGGGAGGLEDPGADVEGGGAAGQGLDEFGRGQQAALGVPPAQQGLGADNGAIGKAHLRLVVKLELRARAGPAQLGLQVLAHHRPLPQLRREQADPPHIGGLGLVEGEVRIGQHLLAGPAVIGGDGKAEAGADEEVVPVQVVCGLHLAQHGGEGLRHERGRAGLREEEDELVAAEAIQPHARPGHGLQPAGGRRDQPVAGLMAEGVVDVLEAVEVQDGDGERLLRLLFPAGCQMMGEVPHQAGAVRQAGQGIEMGQAVQPGLGGAAFGTVAADDEEALGLFRPHAGKGHGHRVAIRMEAFRLEIVRRHSSERTAHGRFNRLHGRGRHERHDLPSDHVLRAPAEKGLGAGRNTAQVPCAVDDHQKVDRDLEQPALLLHLLPEVRVRPAHRLVRARPLPGGQRQPAQQQQAEHHAGGDHIEDLGNDEQPRLAERIHQRVRQV